MGRGTPARFGVVRGPVITELAGLNADRLLAFSHSELEQATVPAIEA